MMKKLYIALLILLTGLALLAAQCGSPPTPAPVEEKPAAEAATPAPAELVEFKIATQPWIGYGPWYIALDQGFFEKRGLKVELVEFATDQDLNSGLAAGKFDGANIATHTSIILRQAGVDVKAVLLMDASYQADAMIAGEGIGAIADLKGKKVAFEEGTTSDILLTYALMQNGMSKADITPVPMPASDAGAAAIAGQVDVAVTYEPYISAALAQGKGYRILYSAAEKPGLISDVFVFPQKVLAEEPEAVKAMLLAWQDAYDFLQANPDQGQQIIAGAVGSDLAEFKTAWQGVKLYDLAESKQMFGGEIEETYKQIGEVLVASGGATAVPDPNEVFDASFLP
ncbi:MAG: ABC transporter substrate-binding protein [Chloroflexota bacterium]